MKSAMSKTSSNSHSKIIATSNQTTENENKFSLAHFTRNILAILGLNHTFANWTSQTLEDIRTLVHSLTHSVSHVYLLTFCQWFLVVFFFFLVLNDCIVASFSRGASMWSFFLVWYILVFCSSFCQFSFSLMFGTRCHCRIRVAVGLYSSDVFVLSDCFSAIKYSVSLLSDHFFPLFFTPFSLSSYAHFNRSHSFLSRSILFDKNSNSALTHTHTHIDKM